MAVGSGWTNRGLAAIGFEIRRAIRHNGALTDRQRFRATNG